ncbi:hypothetical protein ABKN59_011810 [Abortiporus biennis]
MTTAPLRHVPLAIIPTDSHCLASPLCFNSKVSMMIFNTASSHVSQIVVSESSGYVPFRVLFFSHAQSLYKVPPIEQSWLPGLEA